MCTPQKHVTCTTNLILEKEGEKEKSELQLLQKKNPNLTQIQTLQVTTTYYTLQALERNGSKGRKEVREIATVLVIKASTTKEKCDVNLSSSPCPKWDF